MMKHAFVTGGGGDIGAAIGARAIAAGYQVVLVDQDGARAKQQATQLKGAIGLACDVSDEASVEAALDLAATNFGGVPDLVVNCAGITGPVTQVWNYPVDDWQQVMDVNINGVFFCCREWTPHLKDRPAGRIVNIASVAGKDGNPNASAYSASKAAVMAITKSLGKELANTNVRVNCVTPAAVKTAIFAQMTPEHIQFMLSKIPMGRFGTPEEVAAMVTWLLTEDCSFSTGAVFDLSGGRSTY